jgi:hypothetical protein
MKKPRLTDFQTGEKLSELRSPMDDMPAIEKPVTLSRHSEAAPPLPAGADEESVVFEMPSAKLETNMPARPNDGPSGTTRVRPPDRAPVRKIITRCSFELFQDQMERLRHLSLQQKIEGGKGSMSEMVREALDAYLLGKEDTE